MRRVTSLIHTLLNKICSICLNYVIINENYIYQRENTDHAYAIVRTSRQATHMVRGEDLAPEGTVLVTPAVNSSGICTADMDLFRCVIL